MSDVQNDLDALGENLRFIANGMDILGAEVSRLRAENARLREATETALAIAEFQAALPGWWFTLGHCSVSRDASCGPDRNGPDAALLEHRHFDEGFHEDGQESMADVLRNVMCQALEARAALRQRNDSPASPISSPLAGETDPA